MMAKSLQVQMKVQGPIQWSFASLEDDESLGGVGNGNGNGNGKGKGKGKGKGNGNGRSKSEG